jgi:RES domain-containing protein
MRYGSEWLRSGRAAVLEVPSVLVPGETNLLLNPAHVDFKRLRIARARAFSFDPRLWS